MSIDNFVLGTFVGLIFMSALVVAAVITLSRPGYRRSELKQSRAKEVQKRKTVSVGEKPSIFSRIMSVWGKGDDLKESWQREEPVRDNQLPNLVPTIETQESRTNDVSTLVNEDEQVSPRKPGEDIKPALVEGVDTSEIDTAPASLTEESAGTEAEYKSEDNSEKPAVMGNIPLTEEDGLAKYSPKEEAKENPVSLFQAREKGDWASAFTDIHVEESLAGKLAKSLNNVDIQDLLSQCRALIKPNRERKP